MQVDISTVPTLRRGVRMRECRAYANLPPMYASMWSEYKALRSERRILSKLYNATPADKDHFKLVDGKPRRVVHVGPKAHLYKKFFKIENRLVELAQYFWVGLGWIAPDYTMDEVIELCKEKRHG